MAGAHLRRGFQRRAPPLSATLNVAVHVLQHNDGIVHHAANRDGEAAKGHEVERHVLPVHQENAGEYAQGDGQADDQSGANGGEQTTDECRPDGEHEGKDHGHREEEAKRTLAHQCAYLTLDVRPLVAHHDDVDVVRDAFDAVQDIVDCGRDVEGVGLRLPW